MMEAIPSASSSVHHGKSTNKHVIHEQCFLMSELESLGLSTIRLNEFNNNEELRNLVYGIKGAWLSQCLGKMRW